MRCEWSTSNERMIEYHDTEWGTPVHDDQLLFEHLSLDGFQAGLSWQTILNKRVNFRAAFDHFDPGLVAAYNSHKINELLANPGIVRNRLKITATIENARQFLKIREEHGSFDAYIWGFTSGKTIHNSHSTVNEIPAKTELSDRISADLKKKGFTFVGSTIIYAFLQATGIVNDHVVHCFRYQELKND